MRTQEEINTATDVFCEKERTSEVEAVLDVLESDMDDATIEAIRYYYKKL